MDLEKANKKLRSRNFTKFGLDMNLFVSGVTAVLVLAFIIFTISKPVLSAEVFSNINTYISTNFNWLYVITINASLIFLLYLGFSKYGRIRLGGYTAKPEFSNIAWYAMMFSAGLGLESFFME